MRCFEGYERERERERDRQRERREIGKGREVVSLMFFFSGLFFHRSYEDDE